MPLPHFHPVAIPCKAFRTRAGRLRRNGFTLIEMLLSTVLGGMIIASVTFLFANLSMAFTEIRSTQTFAWECEPHENTHIPLSPAYSQLPKAIQLQAALMEAMESDGTNPAAGCIFVLGGVDETGVGDGFETDLPSVEWPAGAVNLDTAGALDLTSPAGFAGVCNIARAEDLSDDEAHDSFSIYVVRNRSNLDMVVHCRRADADGNTTYTVTTMQGGDVISQLSYAFCVSTEMANSATVRPGAIHYWLRDVPAWRIADHVGTQVIFPDPTAMPYQVDSDDATARAFSRLVIFLPTKP
jgi:prepilin-type N-terminal cleavage/methylation domain-containing protein